MPIKLLKTIPKNKNAIVYIVKGLIAQLAKSVRATGFGVLPARMTRPKSIFTIMGYIIKKRHIAIGIETTGASPT
ncbi:hypothetical protein ES703_37050 [subsurface metagenome]